MSTCPEKDIHSVYLDGELPEQFRAEYEAHIAACEKCRGELEKLRKLQQLFVADSAANSLDSVFMEQSFERLQTKLRYSDHVQAAAPQKHVFAFSSLGWTLPAAAAAAVFALIFTPAYLRTSSTAGETAVTAIASAELEPLSEKQVVIDGNISHSDLSSLALTDSHSSSEESGGKQAAAEQRTVRATATVGTGASRTMRRSFTSVDVFKPDVVDAAAQLPIKIDTPIPFYGGEKR